MIAAALLMASLSGVQTGGAADMPAHQPILDTAPKRAIPRGTMVQLMVLREINSRSARPGERYKLRVNAPVIVGGEIVVPVGGTAWGEVVSVSGTSIAGARGRLTMRVVELETASGPVRLTGTLGQEGKANTAGVAIGVLSFGLAGLLNKGGNATFKAGDLVTAYVDVGEDQSPIVPQH